MQASTQLFVYGSLRKGFLHPAYEYISRYFSLIGEGRVKGRLYDMGDYPAAIPTADGAFIAGELYSINHPDEFPWAIAQLDDYEGLTTEHGESSEYRRELVTVFLPGTETEAWVYWFNRPVNEKALIESGDVLQYMRNRNTL